MPPQPTLAYAYMTQLICLNKSEVLKDYIQMISLNQEAETYVRKWEGGGHMMFRIKGPLHRRRKENPRCGNRHHRGPCPKSM